VTAVPKLRFGLLLVVLAVLVVPGTAAAAPALVHATTTVTEIGTRDGVIAGGDTITILERVSNTTAAPISGLQSTLTTSTAGVGVTQGASPYPTIAAFAGAENSVPFEVTLPASLPCGAVVELSLALSAPGLAVSVALTVRTGFVGSPAGYARGRATDIPNGTASLTSLASLGGPGSGTSTISVPTTDAGTVRGIQVHLGHLAYPLGHLRISLRAPNSEQIVLLDHRGGSAQALDDTTFAVGGADPALTSNLTAATVRPEESFDALLGNTRAGNWRLVFDVDDSSEFGTLDDWRIDFTLADCAPRAFASLVATPSQVAPGGDVTLDASGTVVDAPATYAYSTPGGFATITGANTAQAHATFTQHGSHTVTVTVFDSHGTPFTKDAVVVVSGLPTAVLPTPADAFTGVPITFNASGSSDPDPGALSFEWSVDGGTFSPGNSTLAVPFATPGPHHVTVRVTDVDGATAEATAIVTAQNRPPVAMLALAAPPAVTGRSTVLDASASSDDGAIVRYRWDLDGDTTNGPGNDGFEVDGAAAPTQTAVFGANGLHTVRVEVTDDNAATTIASLAFDVTNAPVAGTIQATPTQPRPNTPVTLTVSGASDSDGSINHYEWDFGDGAQTNPGTSTALHTFTTRALRTITVRVVDDKGASSTTSLSLPIGGIAPVAVLTVAANPVARGATAHFDASGSHDSDSAIGHYAWDLNGDGVFELDTGLTPTAEAAYPNAGSLTVRVRVIDEDGNAGVAGIALAITAPPGTGAPGGDGSPPAGPDGSAAGGGQQNGADGPSAGAGGHGAFAAVLAASAIQTQQAVLRSGVVVTCQTNRRATCVLRIELAAKDARRLGVGSQANKPVVIAHATVRTEAGKGSVAKLRLTKAAAAKLSRAARVTVLVTGEATSAGGDRSTLSRSILLRRR
jgi:subtilisin-like proprotein convertase family protein